MGKGREYKISVKNWLTADDSLVRCQIVTLKNPTKKFLGDGLHVFILFQFFYHKSPPQGCVTRISNRFESNQIVLTMNQIKNVENDFFDFSFFVYWIKTNQIKIN